MNNKNTFSYTYSSAEQEEIRRIRKKYAPPASEETPLQRLRRLDASVSRRATTASVSVGVVGTLTMGCGMSLIMTDLSATLGMAAALPLGIGIGFVGIALCLLALPIYRRTLAKCRARIASDIRTLTDELLK